MLNKKRQSLCCRILQCTF